MPFPTSSTFNDGLNDFGILNFGGTSKLALSGSLYLGNNIHVTYTINDPGGIGTLSGQISGTGALTITGSPTLAGVNTYSGSTTLSPGASVTVTNGQAFGVSALVLDNSGIQASTPLTGANALANRWAIGAGSAAYFNGSNAFQLSGSSSLAAGAESIHVTNPN